MKIKFLSILFLSILLISCESDNGVVVLTGNIVGYVRVYDVPNDVSYTVNDNSGVNVTIERLGISTKTDSEGKYIFENIPQGTYTISLYKENYSISKIYNVSFAGNGTYYVDMGFIVELPNYYYTELSLYDTNENSIMLLAKTNKPVFENADWLYSRLVCYFGRNSDVNANINKHEGVSSFFNGYKLSDDEVIISISRSFLTNVGFISDEKIYVAVYASNSPSSVFDPELNKEIYNNLSSKYAVTEIIIP